MKHMISEFHDYISLPQTLRRFKAFQFHGLNCICDILVNKNTGKYVEGLQIKELNKLKKKKMLNKLKEILIFSIS